LDPRPRARRALRHVAGGRTRLVDQPQPLLGLSHPRLEERRPRLPAGRRLREPGRDRAGLRGAPGGPPSPGGGRAGTPEPRRPQRAEPDAPRAGGARLLVRVRLDALRAGPRSTTRSRTASGSTTTSRRTSSSSTSLRRAAGSTP
jgi:hypothetical protein